MQLHSTYLHATINQREEDVTEELEAIALFVNIIREQSLRNMQTSTVLNSNTKCATCCNASSE